MNRLIKLAGAFLLGACGLSAPGDASAQCPGGVCGVGIGVGIGGGVLATSYSYTTAWPGAFVTPGYVASVPMVTSYAFPARVTPFRSVRVIGPAMQVFDPPILWPIP